MLVSKAPICFLLFWKFHNFFIFSPVCLDICRVCHCQYDDLENHIHDRDPKPHQLWSVNEYDRIVESLVDEPEDTFEIDSDNQELEEDEVESAVSDDSDADFTESSEFDEEQPVDNRGIKSSCPLNVLESFYSIWGRLHIYDY